MGANTFITLSLLSLTFFQSWLLVEIAAVFLDLVPEVLFTKQHVNSANYC